MKLPIYDISINLDDTDTGMCCCSLVEDAAVSVDFLAFNKETEDKQHQLLQFKNDGLEHKIFGVAIRCGYPIYRIDNYGREFYVRFNKEVIEQIVLKYSKEGLHNLVSLNHDGNLVSGITLVEMFIKNTEKGISPVGFEDIEDGSLFVTYKVEDDDIWSEIVNKNVKGFSIEIISDIVPTNETIEDGFSTQEPEEEDINSFINDLYNYLVGEGIDDIDILFDSKKKIDIDKIIDDNLQVEIKVNNTSKIIKGWVYTEYVVNGSKNLAIWDNRSWHTVNENNIDIIKVVDTKILPNWNNALKHPDFNNIHNTVKEADGVQKKADTPQNFWEDIIMNKKIVLLKYDDESNEGCTTYRQCLVCEYGYTTAGNACLRAYQYTGATHTGDINPLASWRNFLIKRLIDIKVAPGIFEPIDVPPPGFNPNDDKDGFTCLIKAKFNTDEEKSNGN